MATSVSQPSLGEAVKYWLMLGCVSFGGPAGQIALMHAELVEKRRWISERRFLHALNYCMLLPGPEATQLAIYIGWLIHGIAGGILAGVLFLLPSLLLIIGLSALYLAYGQAPWLASVLYVMKPVIVAIVLMAAWRLGQRTLKGFLLGGLALAAFLSILAAVPFPVIILSAACVGAIGVRIAPSVFSEQSVHRTALGDHRLPALIDDDTPTPVHARFSWRRFVAACAIGIAIVAAGLLVVAAQPGLLPMGWFFTKAALMTFGGAYAVLPYVYQGAVEQFQWLSTAQMMDGLALGETTPGPLIMVVAFVGYLGAGLAGACVAAFFTFVPSFVFILVGGPVVEASRDDTRMTAPLKAISAAVVGVIASLAVFFGQHVYITPAGVDWPAIALTVGAVVAMARFRIGTIPLIAAAAFLGILLAAFRV